MAYDNTRGNYQAPKTHTSKVTAKGTELPLIDLKGKPYLTVPYRIVWMREEHPDWTIETEFVEINTEKGYTIAKATISVGGVVLATAHKVETKVGFADYLEKSETGAIGRALALCGYGTQFEPELEEGDRIVDSPITPITPSPVRRTANQVLAETPHPDLHADREEINVKDIDF